MNALKTVGVVLPALNEGAMLEMTVSSLLVSVGSQDDDLQIVVVDDGSSDGCTDAVIKLADRRVRVVEGGGLGVSGARNRGAQELDTDILVFMDAHCTVEPGWLDHVRKTLQDPQIGLLGPAFTKLHESHPRACGMRWDALDLEPCWFTAPASNEPFAVPFSTGACQIFTRDRFEKLGRYDEKFTRWGYEDIEMCLRVWSAGLTVTVCPSITVGHYFREDRSNYEIEEIGVVINFLRMIYLHLSPRMIREVLASYADCPQLHEAQQVLFETSIFRERELNFQRRERDDLWFFREINGPLVSQEVEREEASAGSAHHALA